jgi:hypothetical protein
MRRFIPPVLVGLGVFILVSAALIKFYAYPKLAVAPIDQDSVTRLTATDAVVFDTDPNFLREVSTDLSVASTTRADVKASEKATDDLGEPTRVWIGTTTITDAKGIIRSQSADSTVFDANTAENVTWGDNGSSFVEDEADVQSEVKRTGLAYKFPFGTEEKTYKWWDDTILGTVDMKFVKETEIDGMTVYQFEGEIPKTIVGSREVPASVLGEPGTDSVAADSTYANTRTFWIEPNTGVIIDRREQQRSTLELDGEERVITTEADLSYTDAQVSANVDEYESKASSLALVSGILPILGALVGLLLIAGGLLLKRSGSGTRRAPDAAVDTKQTAKV